MTKLMIQIKYEKHLTLFSLQMIVYEKQSTFN